MTVGRWTVPAWPWAYLVVFLALYGLFDLCQWAAGKLRGLAGQVRWWLRDRVTPLLEDDRIVAGKCEACCWAENGGEGCDWAMCGCACHDEDELPPLPPERTWEQMTSHQLPVVADRDGNILSDKPPYWRPPDPLEPGAAGHFPRPPGYSRVHDWLVRDDPFEDDGPDVRHDEHAISGCVVPSSPESASAAAAMKTPIGTLTAARERRMPGWEAESRQAYAALDLDYPSGLMARVREAAQ